MSKKIDRALYGPSWVEVILGAVLSLVLGGLLATVYLVIKPVQTVKEMPKEKDIVRGAIYYIEGSNDATKGKQWTRKRQQLAAGESVVLTEEELNAVFAPSSQPGKPGTEAAPAPGGGVLNKGTPNFRLRDGRMQIGVPCTITVLGYSQPVTVVATGTFVKDGDTFVFDPDQFHVGSLAVNRLPMVEGFVKRKLVALQVVPEDLTADWKKLANVSLEGKSLRLTMP